MLRDLCAGVLVSVAGSVAIAQESMPLAYEQVFDDARAVAEDFRCSDARVWRLDRGSLWQFAASEYEPVHRSPYNIALLGTKQFGSFVLEADVMQTGREYGHRDVCVVFGWQGAEHFCYAHLSTSADQNAHNVFVVDDAPRTPITTSRSDGVDWGRNTWKRVRIEYDAEKRTVRVLVDGEEVMFSDAVPFSSGLIGFGSFDDEARIDNVRVWSDEAEEAVGTVPESFGAVDALQSAEGDSLRFASLDDRVRVSVGGEVFAEYVWRGTPKPHLAVVCGPGSVRMTRSYPMETVPGEAHDHPHHTGLWWAHGDINGLDLWHGKARAESIGEPTVDGDTITCRFALVGDDGTSGVTIVETVRCIELPNSDRAIDFGVEVIAPDDHELVFGDTKEGTMAIRTHPALRLTPDREQVPEVTGRARNSEGVEGKELWGKRAAWVDYSGEIDGKPVGVAIFDHPDNPRFPTWWHARDYGLVAANPFGTTAYEGGEADRGRFVVPVGESVSFRYRFLFHRFDTGGARVGDGYELWRGDE